MGIEVFLFALMIFGMVLIVLFLFLHGRQQKSGMNAKEYEEKEEKLMLLYFEVEDMINGLKEYVENARQVIDLEYDRAKEAQRGVKLAAELKEQPPPEPVEEEVLLEEEEEEQTPEDADTERIHAAVRDLATQDMTTAEIAEKLQLSKSEVRLILRLPH